MTLPPALLVQPTPGRRTAFAGVWLARGAAHDAPDEAGVTHLLEHLTLRRCGDRSRRELARLVDRLGGEVDAWTSSDAMAVSVQTTTDAMPEALDLLVDAVTDPTFDPEDVELERRVTLAELEMVRDDPAEQVEEALLQAAWGDHPMARPVIGSEATVAALTPDALRRHHQRLLASGGVLAVVAGDVDSSDVRERLARLPLDALPVPPPLPPLAWVGGHMRLSRDGIDQVHARLAFPTPPVSAPEIPSVVVLNRLLGVGASSRLFQRLREDEGLTYDIWSGLALRHQGGLLEVGWVCSTDVFSAAVRAVREELAAVVRPTTDEVEVAKEALRRGLDMDVESVAGLAALDVGEVLDRGRRFDLEATRAELDAVTAETVAGVASRVLDLDRMASAVCSPTGFIAHVA
jgi:predicted Zn-dependent peptidase